MRRASGDGGERPRLVRGGAENARGGDVHPAAVQNDEQRLLRNLNLSWCYVAFLGSVGLLLQRLDQELNVYGCVYRNWAKCFQKFVSISGHVLV